MLPTTTPTIESRPQDIQKYVNTSLTSSITPPATPFHPIIPEPTSQRKPRVEGAFGVSLRFHLDWRGLVRVRVEHDECDVLGAIDEESRCALCQSFF